MKNEIHKALFWCKKQTELDGNEHALVLGSDGAVLKELTGDSESVRVVDERGEYFMRAGQFLVHSHPDCSSLSTPDIAVAQLSGAVVMAIAQDGGLYWSKGYAGKLYGGLERLDQLRRVVAASYRQHVLALPLPTADCVLLLSHITNLVLKRDGMIDYHFHLSEHGRELVERAVPQINQMIEDRAAVAAV